MMTMITASDYLPQSPYTTADALYPETTVSFPLQE